MASESEAVLFNRLQELELLDLAPVFTAKGWNNPGKVAFSTTYAPTHPDDKQLVVQFMEPLVGSDTARYPALRRLWFEC